MLRLSGGTADCQSAGEVMKKIILKKLLFVGKIFFGLILALVIIVSVFPLMPPFKNYYHSRTVLTGSMEPKIPKGSVVINQWADQKNLKVGDVITYRHPSDSKIMYVTHRIVKIDKTGLLWRFETKGDANPASDFGLITQAGTEGKVILMIPLIGYLIEFFKSPVGFIVLIALPLLIFIVQQTRDVLRLWSKLTVMLVALAFLAARVSFVTYASFTSGQATITGVTLSTATSFPGDVVINEVMWMGTSVSGGDDEWVELKNTTLSPINLSGWKINLGPDGSDVTLSGTIQPNEFFLITERPTSSSAINDSISSDQIYSRMVLPNSGRQLTLKDPLNNVIDQTPTGKWPAGTNVGSDKKSMERNDDPAIVWHTCLAAACHSTTYWDTDGHNWGTPKAANLSGNDPSAPPATSSAAPASPSAQLTLSADQKNVSFVVNHIGAFKSLSYQLSYDTSTVPQGVLGKSEITGDSYSSGDILLGTCSTIGTCVYHSGVKNFNLEVNLTDSLNQTITIKTNL